MGTRGKDNKMINYNWKPRTCSTCCSNNKGICERFAPKQIPVSGMCKYWEVDTWHKVKKEKDNKNNGV